MKYTIIVQEWLESEAGWGISPDGYSLHCNEKDRELFIKAYWARMPNEVQTEYSRPSGQPYSVEVSSAIYKQVKSQRLGLRLWEHQVNINQAQTTTITLS